MKRLYLARHAKSSWKKPQLDDIDRPLNKRGKRDTPVMGQRLRDFGADPDLIITSPAKRARKTAIGLAKQLDYPKKSIAVEEILYGGYVEELIGVINRFDTLFSEVLLVGHNPDFTDLANILANQKIDNVPTCGIVAMDFSVISWQAVQRGSAKVVFFDYPKKVS